MRRPTCATRFIALASLVAMVGSLMVTAPVVLAARPVNARTQTLSHRAGLASPGHRPFRQVDVRRLPQGAGKASPSVRLAGPTRPTASMRAPLVGPPPPVEATATGAQASERTAYAGLASGTVEPPDSGVAAGPDHVVQVAATGVRITNRSGTQVGLFDLQHFFGISNLTPPFNSAETFSPRVIFDSLQNRWVAIETSFDCVPGGGSTIGTGYVDIAYSLTADPTGSWGVLSLAYNDFVPDDLAIGTSTDKVVVSANVLALVAGGGTFGCQAAGFLGTELDVMAWSELLSRGNVNVQFLYSPGVGAGFAYPELYSSWRPSRQTPATSEVVHVIGRQNDGGVAYATLSGNPGGGGSAILAITDLTAGLVVSGFATPPAPQQPGSPATITAATDGRPTDAVWQNDRLVYSSTYPCDPAGGAIETRDCVRVTELNTATTVPSLSQDFLLAEDGADLYMGGAALAGNGDLHVIWTRSSATAGQYPSSETGLQLSTNSANTLGVLSTIAAGTGTYPGSRWGDYAGIALDPQVPNAVWQAGAYAVSGSMWATRVSQLQTDGSEYTPITPLRVLDTRPAFATGLSGVFPANTPRSWQVAGFTSISGSIPANAIAVTGNVTVTNQTAAGYLSVTPNPTATPASSTINFPLGDNRANNVTVPLSDTGMLSATYKAANGKSTNLIFDVTGYFTAGLGHATYTPVSPATRVLDSRPGISTGLSGRFVANTPRTLTIGGASGSGVPADAVAITGNLTVINQTRAGYISVTPDPDPSPQTSNLNFPLGDTRANGISARLNASGQLSIVFKSSGTADVILDVTGYYRNVDSALSFYPLSPGRIMDSRPGVVLSGVVGSFNTNGPRTLTTAGHWGVPAGAAAITGNLTVVGQTDAGYVSITVLPTTSPPTSSINFPLGDTRANGVTVPTRAGTDVAIVYKAQHPGRKTHLILDVTGYFK